MKTSILIRVFTATLLVCLIFSTSAAKPVTAQSTAQYTLADLGMTAPVTLTSPVSETVMHFNLPVEWVPEGEMAIDLNLSAFFSSLVASEQSTTITGLVGGNLSVFLNGRLVGATTLSEAGSQTFHIEFDSSLIIPPSRGSSNKLTIRWDGSASCLMNLLSSITLDPASQVGFNYTENKEDVSLSAFPVPFIIEGSLQPVPLNIVIPAAPSLAEMRAAMVASAGIGRLSQGTVTADVVTIDEYLLSSKAQPNLIVITGLDKTATDAYKMLGLPRQAALAAGDGSLQLFKMDTGRYGLLVTGDDAGLLKAAQVLSANQVIASRNANSMIVNAVNPAEMVSGVEDITLSELGVGELLFTRSEGLSKSFDFYIPADRQARPDSYFGLTISHSQQLDYLRSGVEIKLNGYPAASLRLNDTTSNEKVFQLILASNLIHPGRNTIQVIADLYTRDLCTEPVESIAWLRVSSDSMLHLPLENLALDSAAVKTFSDFPDQFLSGSGLDNILIVLSSSDSAAWKAAGALAWRLGSALPREMPIQLQVNWSDGIDDALAAKSNVILTGKPLHFSGISENLLFPSLKFTSKDVLSKESAVAVVSQPEAGSDVGYLAIRGYADGSSRVQLAVFGNTAQGINNAVSALNSSNLAASNLAVVADEGVQSGWMDQGIASGATAAIEPDATEVPASDDTVQKFRQNLMSWGLPLIALMLVVLLVLVIAEFRRQPRK